MASARTFISRNLYSKSILKSIHLPTFASTQSLAQIRCSTSKSAEIDFSHPQCNVPSNLVDKIGRNLHLQLHHPLNTLKTTIETYFTQQFVEKDHLGVTKPIFRTFDQMHPVVTTTSNFDDLLVPQDHVSRRPTDTYYVTQKSVLRTHTSAHQTELIRRGENAFLVTGDVYRRDEIDSSHYPVFHQMEGVRVFNSHQINQELVGRDSAIQLVESDLKKTLEGMVREVFGDVQMRWVEAYFPFTDPSFELEIYFNDDWLEVLGCGMIHQDILKLCNVGDRVGWAFGLGLERLAMVLFDIPDIRLFWTEDKRFHDQFSSGKITKFKPYSKYPPCYKDISFWIPSEYHDNDLYSLVRDVAQDLVESVELIDHFEQPKTKRQSKCYRINYRSMDRSLTNAEIDEIQSKVRNRAETLLKVELR